uniref:Uncharacterized protein n=1 Tax=Otus sunia TaxID=257818 RepID=A0A8C8E6G9_9STRI
MGLAGTYKNGIKAGTIFYLENRVCGSLYSTFAPPLSHGATACGQLNAQLEGWLSHVQSTKSPVRVITAPHAGYTCCGSGCCPGKERTRTLSKKIQQVGDLGEWGPQGSAGNRDT